jgi:hypothetical protein
VPILLGFPQKWHSSSSCFFFHQLFSHFLLTHPLLRECPLPPSFILNGQRRICADPPFFCMRRHLPIYVHTCVGIFCILLLKVGHRTERRVNPIADCHGLFFCFLFTLFTLTTHPLYPLSCVLGIFLLVRKVVERPNY